MKVRARTASAEVSGADSKVRLDTLGGPEVDLGNVSGEELLAAGVAACMARDLDRTLRDAGGDVGRVEVSAEVIEDSSGVEMFEVRLVAQVEATGFDEDTVLAAARAAQEQCSLVRALSGTRINMDTALAPAIAGLG